jgi:hypothetical protein
MIPARIPPCAILIALLLLPGIAAAADYQFALGDTVPLSGYSYGSDWAYLFLTGPNLPVNGVMLNDVTKRADQGYFTKVQTDGNGHWSYKWGTSNVGGRLDEGTYTVWVVNGPNDLSRLSQADYGTISVSLGKPGLSVDAPVQYGSMDITSSPDGSSVSLDGRYRGQTPMTIPDLPAGSYRLNLTHFGYNELSTPVTVVAGRVSEISATLDPRPDVTQAVTTIAAASPAPVAPAASPTPTAKAAGLVPAVFLLVILFVVREISRSR